MTHYKYILFTLSAIIYCNLCHAQLTKPQQTIDPNATLIYLEHCQSLNYNEELYPGAQLLKGDVVFRHDSALMYCDSAFFYEAQNSLDAFGNIRFEQGDTLFGYGDILYYNGNTKLAKLRHNVRLVHFSTILTTDSLNYDRIQDVAYYFNSGTIKDSLNTLQSIYGQYQPPTKQATFKDSVVLINENFNLKSDTLTYNTETHIARILSPTMIVYQEETTILSSRGWYNTETEQSTLLDHSHIIHTNGKQLTGDSILYDKKIGIGHVFNHMELADTTNKVTLYGNYGEYYEEQQKGLATDSALAIDRSDSLWLYIHADSIITEREHIDSIPQDTFQCLFAYRNVRIYREDVQAVCDSLAYHESDSIIRFYYNPIAWNDSSQMSADSIQAQIVNGEIDHIHCYGSAITIQQEEDEYYNQMAGKEIIAWIRDGELRQIDVNGNAETVFFPREDNNESSNRTKNPNENKGDISGVNKTQSSFVKIFIKDQKMERILFTTATTGTMFPLDDISIEQTHLNGFFTADLQRPTNPDDVFRQAEKAVRPEAKTKSASISDKEIN